MSYKATVDVFCDNCDNCFNEEHDRMYCEGCYDKLEDEKNEFEDRVERVEDERDILEGRIQDLEAEIQDLKEKIEKTGGLQSE